MPFLGDSLSPQDRMNQTLRDIHRDMPASRERRRQDLIGGISIIFLIAVLFRFIFRMIRRLPVPVQIPVFVIIGLFVAVVVLSVVDPHSAITMHNFFAGL